MKNFKRGSEWRKWDLHVHTPYSIYQKFGNDSAETWEKYIEDLESLDPDFAVLGINDYFFIDGYEKLLNEKSKGRLNNVELFPVLEFRIEKFAGVEFGALKRINLHVIFSNEVSVDDIKNQFLNTLHQSYHLEEEGRPWHKTINRQSIEDLGKSLKENSPGKFSFSDIEVGFSNININEKQIFDALRKDCFSGKYLIAIGKTEWGDLKWTKASISVKKNTINTADIVFTSAPNIDSFEKSLSSLKGQNVNSKLLDCSDAHYLSSSNDKDRIGNCNTWIKADPTFEGLKQVLYEYDERVCIKETNPSLNFEKPFFTGIKISEDVQIFSDDESLLFAKSEEELPLNQNMVAIIGGRGEGKSMLMDYVSSSFANKEHSKSGKFDKQGKTHVKYSKTNQNNKETIELAITNDKHSVDFIYINQGKLKREVENENSTMSEAVRKFAQLSEPTFNSQLENSIKTKVTGYFALKEFFAEVDEEGNILNDLTRLEKEKVTTSKFIDNITTVENKEKLEKYSRNLEELLQEDSNIRSYSELLEFFKYEVQVINEKILTLNDEKIPEVSIELFKPQIFAIEKRLEEFEILKTEKKKSNEEIKGEFKDYKGDLSTLLNDIGKYQKELSVIEEEIKRITSQKTKFDTLSKEIFLDGETDNSLISKFEKEYLNQKEKLEYDWSKFSDVSSRDDLNPTQKEIMSTLLEDLSIDVIIDFDEGNFYEQVAEAINGSVWRAKNNRDAQKNKLGIHDFNSLVSFLKDKEKFLEIYDSGIFYNEDFIKLFFDEKYRGKYLKLKPTLKYKNKSLNKISVGQKGTVYLKMMLATEAFSKPIIFDQPEDDLDNEFIMNELIDLFKKLKKYRQIIIITHNANLVVNADSEQVIVANNSDGKLSYDSGSLENPAINASICKILEGGSDAFNKRKEKYQFP